MDIWLLDKGFRFSGKNVILCRFYITANASAGQLCLAVDTILQQGGERDGVGGGGGEGCLFGSKSIVFSH